MTAQPIDFLGIGAMKSATSWLHAALKKHPEIWLPYIKELHYFDRSLAYSSPSLLVNDSFLKRAVSQDIFNMCFRKSLYQNFSQSIQSRDFQRFLWNLNFYFSHYNDEWYLSLFKQAGSQVKGEITPAYSILNLEDVRHISSLLPHLKILFILRNPVERAWSHFCFLHFKYKKEEMKDLSDLNEIKKFIERPDQISRSDYVRTLDIWQTCFPEKQIFIGFYDDIKADPSQFLEECFGFLGVNSQKFPKNSPILNQKRLVTPKTEIPKEIELYLAEKYHPMLTELSNRLSGDHVSRWLHDAEAGLRR